MGFGAGGTTRQSQYNQRNDEPIHLLPYTGIYCPTAAS
ncbi:unnamed protein product, partial [marine sediment metagenome]